MVIKCLWSCISMTSYELSIVSLGVMYVSPVYVAPCFLVVPLSRLMCEVMVSYVVCFASGRASRFMYCSHNGCIFCVLYVEGLESFICSWFVGRVRVVLSVDIASSRLLMMRCWSTLLSLACIALVFSLCTSVFPAVVVCFSRIGVQFETPSPHRGATCFSSLSEKLSGRHWFSRCLSYSFGGRVFGMSSRCLALVSSISLEATRRLIAMWLGVCELGMCSNSAPVMF